MGQTQDRELGLRLWKKTKSYLNKIQYNLVLYTSLFARKAAETSEKAPVKPGDILCICFIHLSTINGE